MPSIQTTIRPVPSLLRWILNLQLSKENWEIEEKYWINILMRSSRRLTRSALFLCSISGNTCSVSLFSGLRLFSQPYINMLCLRECACISQYMATPHSSISLNEKLYKVYIYIFQRETDLSFSYLLIMAFVYQIDGYVSRITVRYWRFKSLPVRELRVLPTITPSGLSIGTSLNMNLCRKRFATVESPVMKSIRPFIIHDDGVSLGCTRADTTIDFLRYEKEKGWDRVVEP